MNDVDGKRIRTSAEVKTPQWIVEKMVDNIEPVRLNSTYLEICCWDAPFLMEILKRKLRLCSSYDDVLAAYKTIYGYEFHEDNLEEGRENLKSLFPGDKNINVIVNTNLQLMDGLTGLNPVTGKPAEFYDWEKHEWFTLKRQSNEKNNG